jgi:sugar phosphate isomerase/epimerase
MRLGLVTYNLANDLDLDGCLELCEKTGFEGLEFRTTHAHGVEPTLNAEERKAVVAKAAASPVELVSLGSTCEYHSTDPEELQRNIDETKAFIDLAADLGMGAVKVRPNRLLDDVPVEETLKQIGLTLKGLGDYAAEKGVTLQVEVHGRGTSNPPHMHTIFTTADHPAVRATWNCNATDLIDGEVEENFRLLRPWITMLHIHDLAEPTYPWQRLFELLNETEFDGWTLVESPGNEDPERILKFIKAIWDLRIRVAQCGCGGEGCCEASCCE